MLPFIKSNRSLLYLIVLPVLLGLIHSERPVSETSQILKAAVTGKVTLPSSNQQTRVFRGRAYRGRGGNATSSATDEDSETSALSNTIISAHPLSYEVEVEPMQNPAQVNQENATFIPHVTPVTVGSTIQFINDDPFFHNVFSLTPGARFNIGRRPTGDIVSRKVPRVSEVTIEGLGEIQIFCDIHSQMNAVILSLDTPYYTRVEQDGSYTLAGLPAGRYELRAYNTKFNVSSEEISVKAEESIQQNFNFSN